MRDCGKGRVYSVIVSFGVIVSLSFPISIVKGIFGAYATDVRVPDLLAVEDLISSKLNNKRKLARLITQYRDIFFPIFPGRHSLPSSGC